MSKTDVANFASLASLVPFADSSCSYETSTLRKFRPAESRGLQAAIQNAPIDLAQLGKDIFNASKGDEAKYDCLLDGLADKPLRFDFEQQYARRNELITQQNGNEDHALVRLYDANMGAMFKMDHDRRTFNNLVNVVNQKIYMQTCELNQLPARYKFELDRLNALVYFMPFDVIEYSATNSAVVLRAALSQLENFDNWRAIVTLIVKEAYKACIKPIHHYKMSVTRKPNKACLKPEFFAFFKRIVYQPFGLNYHKYVQIDLRDTKYSQLPYNYDPIEHAAAAILAKEMLSIINDCCDPPADISSTSVTPRPHRAKASSTSSMSKPPRRTKARNKTQEP